MGLFIGHLGALFQRVFRTLPNLAEAYSQSIVQESKKLTGLLPLGVKIPAVT